MVRIHPRLPRFEGFTRVSFKGKDRTLRTFRLPFESAYPCHPAFVQSGEDAALRTLKFRFESGGLDQFYAVVAERQRRPIVYRDQKGSTPFHRALSGADDRFPSSAFRRRRGRPQRAMVCPTQRLTSFRGVEHDRTSAPTFNREIAGSIPAYPTGCEAHQDEQAALNRQAERSIRSAPTKFVLG